MISSRLNKVIVIEKGTSGTSSVSSPILSYEDYLQVYANVYIRSATTQYGDSETLLYTTEFEIRYNNDTKEINNKYRVLYNDQYYRIIEVIETEYRHAIKLICQHWYGE
jgi:SPP1 family predicted phage head-tail adaptor